MAVLSEKRWWGYKDLRRFPLLNPVAPANILVSDDASRILTFGNWCDDGYEGNIVAIYSSEGQVIRSFSLKDLLSPGDIQELFTGCCYAVWWCEDHRIDEARKRLILRIKKGEDSAELARWVDVSIDLQTGELSEPMKDRVSKGERRYIVRLAEDAGSVEDREAAGSWESMDGQVIEKEPCELLVPSWEGMSSAAAMVLPEYPPLARLARISGRLLIDLKIAPDGHVMGARRRSGLAHLWGNTKKVIPQWRFSGMDPSACPRRTLVAVDFLETFVPFGQ